MSEINNGRLDQYGAEPFEQQQFGTAGIERAKQLEVKNVITFSVIDTRSSRWPHSLLVFCILSAAYIDYHLDYLWVYNYRPI